MAEAEFLDALVHYRTQFPTLSALGSGAPPAAWKAELDKVSPDAFDALAVTSASMSDGGSASGQRNFPAVNKVRALHALRAELDPTYVNPYTRAAASPIPARRGGFVVRLGW